MQDCDGSGLQRRLDCHLVPDGTLRPVLTYIKYVTAEFGSVCYEGNVAATRLRFTQARLVISKETQRTHVGGLLDGNTNHNSPLPGVMG